MASTIYADTVTGTEFCVAKDRTEYRICYRTRKGGTTWRNTALPPFRTPEPANRELERMAYENGWQQTGREAGEAVEWQKPNG